MRQNIGVAVSAALMGLAVPSPASSGPEALRSRAFSSFEAAPAGAILSLRGSLPGRAAAATQARRPAEGTITGGMNHSPVKLRFDRREWTITGGINLSPVGLRIDHDKGTISGGANLSPVELSFDWSPERIVIEGGANRSPVRLTVDWTARTIEGYANHSPVRVQFDLEAGTVKGYANRSTVDLRFDRVSGELKGAMNLSPVAIKLVNLDLSDFLQHFYLFLRPLS